MRRKLITYSTSSAGPGLPPFQWTWRMRPLWPWSLTPPGPSSSCCRGWGCAAGWTEQGCRAPLSPRWASGSSYPGSPGSPGAPSSTNPPHPPPQIPVNSLGRHQLQKRWDKTLSLDTGLHFSMRQTIRVLINSEMARWNLSLNGNILRTYIYWDNTYYFCAVQINKRNFLNHHSKCNSMCFLSFQMAFSGVSYRLLLMKTRDNAPRLNKNMWGTETKQGRETRAKIQKCFANFNSPKGGKHKMLLLFIVVLQVVCLFALFLGK